MQSSLSTEPDPYSMEHYPAKFQVTLGRQQHNARQLMKHAKTVGRFQNMFRAPLKKNKIDEILKKTGYVEHGGQLIKKSKATKIRKEAARELLRRGNPSVINGPTQKLAELVGDYYRHDKKERAVVGEIRQLLAAGAVVKDAQKDGKNVIFYALEAKLWKVAALLIDHGDVFVTHGGHNLLTFATLNSAPKNVLTKLLDKGIGVDERNRTGRTALMIPIDVDMAKLLIRRGANVNARDIHGMTVLHSSVYMQRVPIVKALLDAGADIDARTPDKQMTALHFAAISVTRGNSADSLKIVKLLIKRGANLNAKDIDGKTPLDLATYPPLIKVLRDAGQRRR